MKVKELIEILQKYDLELKIVRDDCGVAVDIDKVYLINNGNEDETVYIV